MITRILQQLSVQDSPEVQVPLNPRRSVGFHIPHKQVQEDLWNRWWMVPTPRLDPGFGARSATERRPSRAAAVWLEASQEQVQGFIFTLFPGQKKGAKTGRQSSAPLGQHSSPSTAPAYGDREFWVDDRLWKRFHDPEGRHFWNLLGNNGSIGVPLPPM